MTAMLKVCNSYLHVPLPTPISLDGNVYENFRYFKEQWKYYCIATGLDKMPEDVKVSILFLTLGRETFTLLHDNLNLSDEDKNSSDRIFSILDTYFQPKVNVVWERYTFNQAIQEIHETPELYLDRLKKLATSCDFTENIQTVIRDRFICGLRDDILRKELAGDPNITLEKALKKSSVASSKTIIRKKSDEVENKKNIKKICQDPVTVLEEDDDVAIVSKKPETIEIDDDISEEFSIGSFVVLKSDFGKDSEPPIWKIDGSALLQKYVPFQQEGQTLYKNTAVYNGWNIDNKSAYYPAQVVFKQMSRKQHIVRFKKELIKKKLANL
ncbi:uncharacterized protein LOC135833693 [Planococcus citri]|uniref:uncharacterized protein LOC135833693 n=1 Tax=Planococcus citri TaxID=170843 RepID=UPI0031F787DF